MSPSDASQSSSDIRPQADPLPPKVGELAYIAATEVTPRSEDQVDPNDIALRPHPAESTANLPSQSLNTSTSTTSLSLPLASSSSSTHTAKSKAQSIVGYFRGTSNTPMPTIHGIRLSTLLRVLFIIFALIGTALAWGLTIAMLQRRQARLTSEPDRNSDLPAPPPMSSSAATQSIIFIHIAFGIFTLLILVLFERGVFIARAERYRFKNSSDSSSSSARGHGGGGTSVSFAPWNRPSLPTYANALGFRGTGDVEDNAISAPPPPEYGNTRGSTLLLSTMLQNHPQGRPVSYQSQIEGITVSDVHDPDEDVLDTSAHRARRLEESLAALERGGEIGQGSGGITIAAPRPAVLRG